MKIRNRKAHSSFFKCSFALKLIAFLFIVVALLINTVKDLSKVTKLSLSKIYDNERAVKTSFEQFPIASENKVVTTTEPNKPLENSNIAFISIPELGYDKKKNRRELMWEGINETLTRKHKNIHLSLYDGETHLKMKPNVDNYQKFIVVAQDPYERLIHQIQYDKRRETPKYNNLVSYFGTIDNMTRSRLFIEDSSKSLSRGKQRDCELVAKKYIDKRIMEYPQEFYTKDLLLQGSKEIYLIRLNQHEYDKENIKKIFLGEGLISQEAQPARPWKFELNIEAEGRKNLCTLLCSEIQIYKELVYRAVNINSKNKEYSISRLEQNCREQVLANACQQGKKDDYFKIQNVTAYQNKLRKQNSALDYSLKNRRIAFIHIGKTGGTTASKMIRRRCVKEGGCDQYVARNENDNIPKNETQISLQVQEYFHGRSPKIDKYSSFIVTIRHPLARIISWFLHVHPENKILRSSRKSKQMFICFTQIDEFASIGLNFRLNDRYFANATRCQKYALAWLNSNLRFSNYANELVHKAKQKEILVIRTEYFWYDWEQINRMLGETNEIERADAITHKECTNEVVTNRTVSKQGIGNLCYYLCTEIKIYKRLILKAANLNKKERQKSYADIKRLCPKQYKAKKCSYSHARERRKIRAAKKSAKRTEGESEPE